MASATATYDLMIDAKHNEQQLLAAMYEAATAIGNDQPSPQMILILMGIYLSFSLTISLVLNIINRRFQLPGR